MAAAAAAAAAAAHLRMGEQINGRNGVSVPQKSQLSYVVTITISQPSIRIKVPKVFDKAVHSIRSHNKSETGRISLKTHWDMSKRSIGKKVGSMFSKVFGSSKGEAKDVVLRGNVIDGGEMNKLRNMIKRVVRKKNAGKFERSGSGHDHGRMLKSAWWMKKMGRKTEKQELCNKRILMGKKCRPVE